MNLKLLLDTIIDAVAVTEKAVAEGEHHLIPVHRSLFAASESLRRRIVQIEAMTTEAVQPKLVVPPPVVNEIPAKPFGSKTKREAKDALGTLA